ncbi:hypothetical protein BISA_1369 [Bifidobacterium saguini DSM 23967]|uniref:Uncharacterized protein n=1 Tax=Bifidobacterium saguini DSM 23967 TaxID=1437607 RepID=A0A087DCF3_9BIFI|nr:hypothetical protein [Bifidobacterium saguini]KFI93203.1 hypothetical protein BISA_1369 [Bifidobacterium saguini DSM 23967]
MAVLNKTKTILHADYASGATLTGPIQVDEGNIYIALDGTTGLCVQHHDGRLAPGIVAIRSGTTLTVPVPTHPGLWVDTSDWKWFVFPRPSGLWASMFGTDDRWVEPDPPISVTDPSFTECGPFHPYRPEEP